MTHDIYISYRVFYLDLYVMPVLESDNLGTDHDRVDSLPAAPLGDLHHTPAVVGEGELIPETQQNSTLGGFLQADIAVQTQWRHRYPERPIPWWR